MGRSPTNTKSKLLETAKELIWQSSYGSVSVDDICNASGIKKGSFYYYFPSKAELAVAVMKESYENYETELMEVFAADASPIVRFENLATLIYSKQKEALDKYGRVCGCPFASLGSEMAGSDSIIQQEADDIFKRKELIVQDTLVEMVRLDLLPADTDISAKVAQITVTILGQLMMARIQNNINNLERDLKLALFQTLGLETHISVITHTQMDDNDGK